jgi:hypothetical protein
MADSDTGLKTIEEQLEERTGETKEKDLAETVRGWFAEAKAARSTRDPKLLAQYKIYRFYGKQAKFPWRSDIYVPMGHVNVLVKTAKMLTAILASDPFFRAQARAARFAQSQEYVEQLMLKQLEDMGWPRVLHDWILDHYWSGLGILKGYWKYEEVEEEVEVTKYRPVFYKVGEEYIESEPEPYTVMEKKRRVVFDGPAFEVVNIFDFYVDPHATSIKTARYAIHRKEVSIDHLRAMADKGVYDKEAVERIAAGRLAGANESAEKVVIDQIEDNLPGKESDKQPEILECVTPTRIIVVGPDNILLRDDPHKFSRINFFDLPHLPNAHKLFGVGVNEPVTSIQQAVNDTHNLRNDSMKISVHKMWKVSEDAVRNPSDIVARPGGYIRVKGGRDLDQAIKELTTTPLPPEAYMEQDYLERLNETSTGVNEPSKGIERRSGKGETATKTRQSAQGSSTRFGVELILIEPKIKEVLDFMHSLNQTFMDVPQEIDTPGGGPSPLVGPEHINDGKFKFKFELAPIHGDKDRWIQRLVLVSQQYMQNPQTALRTNWPEFQSRLAKAADIRNPDALFGDQYIQQNLQLMLATQGPQGPGGQTGPATNPEAGAVNAQRRAPQPTARDAYREMYAMG